MNSQEQISRILKGTIVESKNWGDSDEKLERTFKFKDFNESMDFVNKVAKIAEEQQHHPDIEIKYDNVKISITDHEKGGVSDKCHKLVKSIDDIEKTVRVTKSDLIRIIKQEEMKEGELTEKCWTGYTQKGMKTMFGKQYPNCVKKTK